MKKDIQQLPQENTIKNDEILQLQRENTNKNNEIQQVRQDNTNKNNEILQLQHDNTNKNHEILQLQQENTNKNNEIEQLQQENTNKNDVIEQLRQQYTNKNNEILQIQRDNTNKNDEVQQLREENTKKNDEIGQLRQQYTNKNNEILQLQQDNANKNNEVQQLRQENTNKNGEIEQLLLGDTRKNNEIRQLRQENSTITESGSVVISNEKLGTGAYGAVYIGNFYGTKVAVKQYHTIILSQYNRKILQREIKIASQCRHPNLLQFICATQNDQDHLVIVTELMDESLRDLLERHARESSQLRNQEVKLTSLDVARGLNYIHSKTPNPIVHRDVSSANVLLWIVNGAVIRAKISDYGSANFLQVCNTANPGAAIYAAPEARHSHQDPKVIIF
jgi:cupin superfamily acireductone dioxygenase involved in methionine salvage